MISPALRHKIARARADAPALLPKARLCASAVLAATEGEDAARSAIADLKRELGNNWSILTALQFLSGRQGGFAVECAPPHELPALQAARAIALLAHEADGPLATSGAPARRP